MQIGKKKLWMRLCFIEQFPMDSFTCGCEFRPVFAFDREERGQGDRREEWKKVVLMFY